MGFWETTAMADMSEAQWESLCDGCGKCCLNKLETSDTNVFAYTRVACRLLDSHSCACSNYEQRFKYVPNCQQLRPSNVAEFAWLPNTCAYRLVAQGEALPEWHHLVCGDKEEVHRADMSVRGGVISEEFVHEDSWDEHVIQWVSN